MKSSIFRGGGGTSFFDPLIVVDRVELLVIVVAAHRHEEVSIKAGVVFTVHLK